MQVEGRLHIDGVPQHNHVDDDAECVELVFLAFTVTLPQFATFAVEDGAGQGMATFSPVQTGSAWRDVWPHRRGTSTCGLSCRSVRTPQETPRLQGAKQYCITRHVCNTFTQSCSSATRASPLASKLPPLRSPRSKPSGCELIFRDNASGGRWDRPELHKLLSQLRKGDVLVVWTTAVYQTLNCLATG